MELARDILGRHPEYGGGRAEKVPIADVGTAKRQARRSWLAQVRALYDEAAVPSLHGRLVVIGLAELEPALRSALKVDGFYDTLVSELREPIETLWARTTSATSATRTPPATARDETGARPAPTIAERLWSLLSPSSKAAIEHAAALTSDGTIHAEHLLLGLYDKPGGPTRTFLDQAGVTRAALDLALAKAVKVRPRDPGTPAKLDALPPLSAHVFQALRNAESLAEELGSAAIRSRHLFYGTLAVTNCEVATALADVGVTAARFREWMLSSEVRHADRRVLAGGISADLVDPDRGIPKEKDDLGVSTYVAMMATAIAREDTKLPLSIGLFGEWGSGKSYFMGLLRKQVKDLASSQRPGYLPGIVQIGFNAWSYADANLWASLGDEIFRELAGPTDDEQEAKDRERREQLRTQLADQQGRFKELENAKATAGVEVAKLRAELDEHRHERRTSAVELLKATTAAVEADEQLTTELKDVWRKVGVRDETEQARVLADAVTGTRDAVTATREAVAAVRWTAAPGRRRYLVAAAVAVAAVLIVAGLAYSGLLTQWLPRVLTGAGLVTVLATVATVTKRTADGMSALANLVNQIRQRTQAGKDAEVKAATDRLREAEAREQVAQAQLDQVVARVGELGRELVELAPGQRLYTFLAERAASEDYRSQLGLIATIRRDLERLAKLQDEWRKDKSKVAIDRIVLYIDDLDRCTPRQVVEVLQAVHLLLALDLFVVVVGVDPRWLLHSLRDQYQSTLHAPPQLGGAEGAAAAPSQPRDNGTIREDANRLMLGTPHDYLEKIFNVPFVLPAMTPDGFAKLIHRLSLDEASTDHDAVPQPSVPAADGDAARPSGTGTGGPAPDGAASIRTEPSVAPPVQEGSEVAAVQQGDAVVRTPLTDPELKILSALAPLVRSPREAKRLLNLYRMLRSTQDLSDASRFLGAEHAEGAEGGEGGEGEFQAVAVLLGLLAASPQLLSQILFAPADPEEKLLGGICHRAGRGTWGAFLSGLRPRLVDERWRNDLRDGLPDADRAQWQLLVERARPASALVTLPDLTAFATWAPHVARFSFLLVPVAGGHGRDARPGR